MPGGSGLGVSISHGNAAAYRLEAVDIVDVVAEIHRLSRIDTATSDCCLQVNSSLH
jgi:hypothetical protein